MPLYSVGLCWFLCPKTSNCRFIREWIAPAEVQRPAQPWSWHLVLHWHFGSERWRTCLDDSLGPTYCSWVFVVPPSNLAKSNAHCEQVSFGCTYLTLLGASVQVFRHIEGQQVKWIRMGIVTQREGPAEKIRGSIACWKVQGGFAKACWICNWVTPSSVLVARIVWQTCQAFQHISTASQLCVLLLDLRLPPIHSNTDEAFVLKLVLSHNDWKICRVCYNHYQSLSPLGWCPSQAA